MEWSKAEAIGRLHMLWWWCVDHAEDGDLTRFHDAHLSVAIELEQTAGNKLMDALVKAGFVERIPYLRLHNWWKYAGRFMRQRYKDTPEKWQRIESLYALNVVNGGGKEPGGERIYLPSGERIYPDTSTPTTTPHTPKVTDTVTVTVTDTATQETNLTNKQTNKPRDKLLMQSAEKNSHSAEWPIEDLWLLEFLKSRDIFSKHGYIQNGILDYTYWDNVSHIVHGLSKAFLEPEFARISTWFDDNPSRKPTQRGLRKFIKGWIERAHEKERRFKK